MDQTHPALLQSSLANGMAQLPLFDGYWWPAKFAWLKERPGLAVSARMIDAARVLGDAPGDYVMVRYAD